MTINLAWNERASGYPPHSPSLTMNHSHHSTIQSPDFTENHSKSPQGSWIHHHSFRVCCFFVSPGYFNDTFDLPPKGTVGNEGLWGSTTGWGGGRSQRYLLMKNSRLRKEKRPGRFLNSSTACMAPDFGNIDRKLVLMRCVPHLHVLFEISKRLGSEITHRF